MRLYQFDHYRFGHVGGHLFPIDRRRNVFKGEVSLCGLTLAQAGAMPADGECQPCVVGKAQRWA
jgi:hypothetical protein